MNILLVLLTLAVAAAFQSDSTLKDVDAMMQADAELMGLQDVVTVTRCRANCVNQVPVITAIKIPSLHINTNAMHININV